MQTNIKRSERTGQVRHGISAYAATAIDSELRIVAGTPSGHGLRNAAINAGAFKVGRFVGAGELSELEAADRLLQAAEENGYVGDHGHSATVAIIESGLQAGQQSPYPVPRSNGRRRIRSSSARGTPPLPLVPHRASSANTGPTAPAYFSSVEGGGIQFPKRTEPNESGKPFFQAGGDDGPPDWQHELRRHLYLRQGVPIRARIKMKDGSWFSWYRVTDSTGINGWQTQKPDGYVDVPYFSPELDPFDRELIGDPIFWGEGEKDCDNLGKHNMPAFTFGGGDGLPDEAIKYVAGRQIIILADNDEKGRKQAEEKAQLANPVAASVRVIHFPELDDKGDVSDFFERGGSVDELFRRVDESPLWRDVTSGSSPDEPHKESKQKNTRSRELVFVSLDNIHPEAVSWIWNNRVPRGKLVVFTGAPGVGKTQALIDIMARITVGGPWPDGSGCAPLGSVIFVTGEDGLADTIRPRAEAAGADVSRIHVLQATFNEHGNRSTFSLQADLELLGQKIEELGDVRLVGIDPVTAYLGDVDSHNTADVRAMLTPLSEFAEKHSVTVCGITHPPKNTGGKAMNAVTGSVAFVAAARAAFLFILDTAADRTLMLPIKSNLSPEKGGLAFRIAQRLITDDILAPHIVWDGDPVSMTADEAMAAENGRNLDPTAKDDAVEFLSGLLANGPMKVTDIETEARAAGCLGTNQPIGQSKPFRSARDALDIQTAKLAMNEGWSWILAKMPSSSEDAL